MHKDRYCRLNFELLSGKGTNLNPGDIKLEKTAIDPDNIQKIILWWTKGTALLNAIELIDKKGGVTLRAGDFHHECLKHEIELKENERLVGVAS